MTVRRIVTNIATGDLASGHATSSARELAQAFYGDILGMQIVMDHGWITTFAADGVTAPQISFATEGGSGAPVPDLSIEVDNFEDVLARVTERDLAITYGPVDEPWGIRRFFLRDPFGRLVNILSHG